MGPKTKSAHLLRWHYGDRVTMGQFSNSFPKHFTYLCEYAIRFDLSCSFCEYPFIFHCLHCSPSCFDPDSLLLAYLWLGLSWIDCISANKSFSSSKTSSRKPYTSSKQQERQKHSVETTINFSAGARPLCVTLTATGAGGPVDGATGACPVCATGWVIAREALRMAPQVPVPPCRFLPPALGLTDVS